MASAFAPGHLSLAERAFWKETLYLQPFRDEELVRAARRLLSDRHNLGQLMRPLVWEREASGLLRLRALGHTLIGAVLAEQLEPLSIEHIHAHHGYFASWMALTAAQLLGIGFSFTLHGSDLLQRADLLAAKLRACQFCVTISDYNRRYILAKYPATPPEKIIVQFLGVDRAFRSVQGDGDAEQRRFCFLSVGRLHAVKNHRFLIEACAALRAGGLDFLCWIAGEGPERRALELQIAKLGLQGNVYLVGHVPHNDLPSYLRRANLVVMTSKSEGIPVTLMEAMAHEKLVLAPAITGIPELIVHQHTGFLYQPGSLPDFVSAVRWIEANRAVLPGVQRAAAASVATKFNRQKNLRKFADQFLACIAQADGAYADPILQQI